MSWREPLPAACWSAERAERALPTEAESPSDGVFLATHSPLPIFALPNALADQGTAITEEEVLEAILAPGDLPIVPVLGPSGSGKSHLVRWLRHRLEADRPDDLVVVFVPKLAMSLKGIALEIIRAGEGPEFDALEAEVRGANQELTEEKAVLGLRSALANLIQTDGAEPHHGDDGDIAELRAFLAQNLPALLNDAATGPTLFRDGAPIHRLALENLHGRSGEDKERAFAFEPEDLDLSLADIAQAGESARTVLHQLAGQPVTRELAATMLNEQLEPAIASVFGIKGTTITDIFLRLRKHFYDHGQRLLLLIEDFSIFQRIQRGVLDAITIIPGEKDELCELRTVMAVTTGYFRDSLPDTVRTRTHRVFDLTTHGRAAAPVDRFVAAYLNAARMEASELDGYTGQGSPPNACVSCPVREQCHDAFGEVDGIGLFPMNASLVEATAAALGGGFVARTYLNQVLKPLLVTDAGPIERREFPSTRFVEANRGINAHLVGAAIRVASANPHDAANDGRRASVVQLYTRVDDGRTVFPSETVYRAFGMESPPGDIVTPPQLPPPPVNGGVDDPPPPPPPPPGASDALIARLETWVLTGEIPQADRTRVLDLVIDAVSPRLGLPDGSGGPLLWRSDAGLSPKLTPEFVALEGTAPAKEPGRVVIPCNDTTVIAIGHLARFRESGSWRSAGGSSARRAADLVIEQIAADVRRLILRREELSAALPHVLSTLRAAAWTMTPRDALDAEPADLVPLLLAPAGDPPAGSGAEATRLAAGTREGVRPKQLVDLVLRTVGYSQGSALPSVVDAAMVLEALDAAPTLPDPERVPASVATYAKLVGQVLSPKQLQARIDGLRATLPDLSIVGDDVDELVRNLSQSLTTLQQAGKLGAAIVALSDLPTRMKDPASTIARLRSFSELVDGLDASHTQDALRALTDAGSLEAAHELATWISDCEKILLAIERLATDESSTSSPLDTALSHLEGALQDLADVMEVVR
jgi:hypothetical protein